MSGPDRAVAQDAKRKWTPVRGRLVGFLLATLLAGYVLGSWLGLFRQVGADARTREAAALDYFGIAPPALPTGVPSLTPTRTPGGPTDTPTITPTFFPTPGCVLGWEVVPGIGTPRSELLGVTAAGANNVWAVGDTDGFSLIAHWNGGYWSQVASPNAYRDHLRQVSAISPNDIWAVGSTEGADGWYRTLTDHWDGQQWSVVPSPNTGSGLFNNVLYGVAAVASDDVWAVGNVGAQMEILHWDGAHWSIVPFPSPPWSTSALLYGVTAISASDVWAVGGVHYVNVGWQTFVVHWDGSAWSVVPSPSTAANDDFLYGVAAASANDVWAVGSGAGTETLTLHWNGSEWSIIPSPNATGFNTLHHVVAVATDDVWAVGNDATAQQMLSLHWDGTQWSVISGPNPGTSRFLFTVAAVSPQEIWAVGKVSDENGSAALVERYTGPCIDGTPITATPTSTRTPTNTATNTPTNTDTPTGTNTPTPTPTRTYTPTLTPTTCVAGWQAGPNLPVVSARGLGVWVPQSNRFFFLGGRTSDSDGAGVRRPYEYNPATNSWAIKNAFFGSDNVSDMDGALLTGPNGPRIYVVGGSSVIGVPMTDVRVYDPVSDTLTTLATDPWPAPIGSIPGGQAVFNNRLYILGGYTRTPGIVMSDQIWEFDPDRASGARWALKSAHLPQPMRYLPAATIGDYIYTAGGEVWVNEQAEVVPYTYRFDPVNDTIDDASIPDLPGFGTSQTRAINWNGQLWVFGGLSGLVGGDALRKIVFVWQPGSASWTPGPALSRGRSNLAVDAQPGVGIYLVGGYGLSGGSTFVPLASMEIYNSQSGSCFTTTPTSTPTITFTPQATMTWTRTSTRTATATPGGPGTQTATPPATRTQTPCMPQTWNLVDSPGYNQNQNYLFSVSALSVDDAWAIGYYRCIDQSCSPSAIQNIIEHWDGQAWSIIPSPDFSVNGAACYGVKALSHDDGWAVGNYTDASRVIHTLTLHWDGLQWNVIPSPNIGTLRGVSGVASNDVWAVGYDANNTLMMHWDGAQWSVVPSPNIPGSTRSQLYAVEAVGVGDAWAVGYYVDGFGIARTLTMRWDAAQWSLVNSPNSSSDHNTLNSVTAVSANDVWAVGVYNQARGQKALALHWDGTQWNTVPVPDLSQTQNYLYGVAAVSSDNVWAVGYHANNVGRSLLAHWDGTQWSVSDGTFSGMHYNALFAVDASPAGDLWAVGHYLPDTSPNSNFLTLTEHYAATCPATRTPTSTPTNTPTNTPTETPIPVCDGPYHYLLPHSASDPANGGTVNTGEQFTLDLWVHSGELEVEAQQAYISYTRTLLDGVSATQTGCVLTSTVTADNTVFDNIIQNEMCNGPNSCIFQGVTVKPGTIGFSSVASTAPYSGPDFRVASLAFCATHPGTATLRWQFIPSDPVNRNTMITAPGGANVEDLDCYETYVINIIGPAVTPSSTSTPAPPTNTTTPSRTRTATPTRTATRTVTGTPPTQVPTLTHTMTPTPTSTPCFSSQPLSEGFESGTLGMFVSSVATCVPGGCGWTVSSDAHTGANAAFVPDVEDISDQMLTTGVSFTVPSGVTFARLTFWHKFALENRFDGAVLEVSNDNGNTWVDGSGGIISGDYNGDIFGNYQNPLAGRRAWTGTQAAYSQVVVNLLTFTGTGRDLRIRFREGTDNSSAGTGWWIDDVEVNLSAVCTTPTLTRTATRTDSPTVTITSTPTPYPTCGPGGDYAIVPSTGASIIAGTDDSGNHCDDCTTAITLPFAFSLYGIPFTRVTADSNGSLQFASDYSDNFSICNPNPNFDYAILPYWADLVTVSNDTGIFTSVTGSAPNRVFNIEWRACRYGDNPCTANTNFEVRLFEGQDSFEVVYGGTADNGLNATTGVQRGAGISASTYSCHNPLISPGLRLTFRPYACGEPTFTRTPDLSATPTSTLTRTPTFTRTPTISRTPTITRTPGGPTDTPTCGPTPGWSAGADFPVVVTRNELVYFSANGKFYSIGGRQTDSAGSGIRTPYEYDPIANTWTQKTAQMPDDQTSNMAAQVLTGTGGPRIYIVGGSAASTSMASNRVLVYDPVADSMTELTTDPWPVQPLGTILPGGSAVVNNKLYILGGFQINVRMIDEIWEFDPNRPAGQRWAQKTARLGASLGYVPATVINNLIYTAGGSGYDGTILFDTPYTFRYDPATDTTCDGCVPDLPITTGETRAITLNGQMWVLGGGRTNPHPSNTVQIYDPGSNAWSTGLPFARARRNFGAAVNPNIAIYLVGGYASFSPTAGMEIFTIGEPCGSPTVTPTRTDTRTRTPTNTPTNTPTITPTATVTDTPTATVTGTPPTATNTPTPTITPTSTSTHTPTATATLEPCEAGVWRLVDSPTIGPGDAVLKGVAAPAADDVWAVGYYSSTSQTLIEHWNGLSWSIIPGPDLAGERGELHAVTALSASDVWAVGNYGNYPARTLVEHWDGTTWRVVPSPSTANIPNNLVAISAASPTDIWAVGYTGFGTDLATRTLILHWDGAAWSIVADPNRAFANSLRTVAALSANDVWAVGTRPGSTYYGTLIEHWNGSTWGVMPSPNADGGDNRLLGINAVSASDIWAVGEGANQTLTEHWDGTAWSIAPSSNVGPNENTLTGVAGRSASDVYAVGYYYQTSDLALTLMQHWDGTQWSVLPSSQYGVYHFPYGVASVPGYGMVSVGSYAHDYGMALRPLTEHYILSCVTPSATPTITPTPPIITPTPTITPTRSNTPTRTITSTFTITPTPTETPRPVCSGAYHYLVPQDPDWCNGCTIATGQRFVLDMMVSTANHSVEAQDGYFQFNANLVQNINVAQPGCVVTNTVTGDFTVFDATSDNQVCNGPNPCLFAGGWPVSPGTLGWASSVVNNPSYNGPDFRVAQVGFCALAPGTVTFHWIFSATTPIGTDILDDMSLNVSDQACYEDYAIHIVGEPATPTPTFTQGPTNTPTPTRTPTRTRTPTSTPTSDASNTPTSTPTNTPTNTPTDTPTHTPTPRPSTTSTLTPAGTATRTRTPTVTRTNTRTSTPTVTATNTRTSTPSRTRTATNTSTPTPDSCATCPRISEVTISCNADGTVHWTATVNNQGSCTTTRAWKSQLLQHVTHMGGFTAVRTERGTTSFPPGTTTLSGDFCWQFPSNATSMRVEFSIDSNNSSCDPKRKSRTTRPCDRTESCPQGFSDVRPDDAYYTEVMSLYDGGVVSGYEDGTFRPYGAVTRAQIAKIVVLAFDFPLVSPVEAESHRFSDVAGDDPFAAYIATAASRGLVSGYADGSYQPTTHVTRGQVAKMVVQVAGLKLLTPPTPSFTDVGEGSPFYSYVETAYARKLVSGYPDGTFRPGTEAGRGQVCKIVLLAAQPPLE